MSRELPIIFNTEMVRAILNGRKTMTRRPVKPQPLSDRVGMVNAAYCGRPYEWIADGAVSEYTCSGKQSPVWHPPYKVGDALYVRETWRVNSWNFEGDIAVDYKAGGESSNWITPEDYELVDRLAEQSSDDAIRAGLEADFEGMFHWEDRDSPCRWRKSIHMFKWAARLHLKVTEVRCERIQDITSLDVCKEGIRFYCGCPQPHLDEDYSAEVERYAKDKFSLVWDSIYSKQDLGWDTNPWVWVYRFEVQK